MLNEFGFMLSGVLISIGIGAFTSNIFNVILGLILTLMLTVVKLQFSLSHTVNRKWDDCKTQIAASLRDLRKINAVLLYHDRVLLNPVDVCRVWKDLLWNVTDHFDATSYISLNFYNNTDGDLGFMIQQLKGLDGIRVRRIFIIDEDSELDRIKHLINKHNLTKVDTYYVKMSNIPPEFFSQCGIEKDFIDFSISDDRAIFVWKLNKFRALERGEVRFYQDREKNNYARFFEALLRIAKKIELHPSKSLAS